MFKCWLKYLIVVVIAISAVACSNTNNKPVIKFSSDSTRIIIFNIEKTDFLEAKNAYAVDSNLAKIIGVWLKPVEMDSLQDDAQVAGKFNFNGDSVIFAPDKPFVKNRDYTVESYIGVEFANASQLMRGNVNQNLKPFKKTLKR